MSALRCRVPHMPGESATSYASRLAACNGIDLATFCRHMGLRSTDIATGRRPTLDAVAALGGVDPETLSRDALVLHEDRRWWVRGQRLSNGTVRRLRPRFCPLCAAEDVGAGRLPARESAYGRTVWSVEPIRTCAAHSAALVDPLRLPGIEAACGPGGVHDFATASAPLLNALDRLSDGVTRREPSAAEAYLLRRLDGGAGGSAWLDTLDFGVAALLMDKVGATAAFGREVHHERLSDADLWLAGDVGFGLLDGGVDALLRFSGMLQDTFRGSGSRKEGLIAIFGRWWWSLNFGYRGPEYEPVMAPLREHVLSRFPVEPGARVLGHVLERRRMHSVTSAAIECGCRAVRLRPILANAGLLPSGHEGTDDAQVVFDAERAAPLLAVVKTRMRGVEAAAYLGVVSVRPFVEDGLLVPLTGPADLSQRLHEFSRADVERLLSDMTDHLIEVDEAGPGQAHLYEAVKMLKRSVWRMSRVILDGSATGTRRLRGAHGLGAVLVDVGEMRALLHHKSHDAVPMFVLKNRLRTKYETLVALVEAGKVFTPETVVSPISGNSHKVVPLAQVERFEEDYVFLHALARERSVHPNNLRRELTRLGVEPAFPAGAIGASIYLRSAVG